MKWTLGPIESLFVTEERVLLATGVVLLVMLVLLARRLPLGRASPSAREDGEEPG